MISEVEHFENEKLVGVVLDYKAAAVLLYLLGECIGSGKTEGMYNAFTRIKEIRDFSNDWLYNHRDEIGSGAEPYNFNGVLE